MQDSKDIKSRIEEMKISVLLKKVQNQLISIQITSQNDPLVLYLLDLSEIEYQNIMKAQKILINFEDFPNFLLNLVKICNNPEENYSAKFELGDSPEAIFTIEEKIKFKITEHIVLKLKKANDEEIKRYLSKIYIDLKYQFEDTFKKLNEANKSNRKLIKENKELYENIQKIDYDSKNNLGNLINEKNNNINAMKENYIKELEKQTTLFENEKKNIINKYECKISEMQNKIDSLSKTNQELEKKILEFEINQKNCEGKYDITNMELKEKIKENGIIKSEYESIQEKYRSLEKNCDDLKYKRNIIEMELEESKKNNLDLNIIKDNFSKQLESNEDNIKSLKASNINLQLKLDKSVEEIKKGNIIIEKLANEIKSKKSQLKSMKQTVDTQEKLINQKQTILDKQTKDLDDLKVNIDIKNKEIAELKNKISDYSLKLIDYEKLLEENKKMILYLNKKLNDIENAPFKSRFQQNFYQPKFEQFGTDNLISLEDFKSNDADKNNNYYLENDININDINEQKYNLNKDNFDNNQSTLIRQEFYLNNINILNNDDEEEGLAILPESNFCNYHISGKLGGVMNKYMNEGVNFENNKNSLLEYKYGKYSPNNENENGRNGSITNKRNTYNIEEEFEIKSMKNRNNDNKK